MESSEDPAQRRAGVATTDIRPCAACEHHSELTREALNKGIIRLKH